MQRVWMVTEGRATRKEGVICEVGQSSGDGEEEKNTGIYKVKAYRVGQPCLWMGTRGPGMGEMTWTILAWLRQ